MTDTSKVEIYQEQFDHLFIAQFGICPAEIAESGDEQMQYLYLVGLWAFLSGKGLRCGFGTLQ
jgi:hypothetical protein